MSNGKNLVAQTYFEVSEVKHKAVNNSLDYSTNVFTYLQSTFTAKGMEPICLNTLEQLINDYNNAKGGKITNRCILKGLYKDGFSGVNCVQNAPYLFFDIDVKKNEENNHLFAESTNRIIFKELQKVSVLVWRSNSGYGIAGVLYVPQMANYLNDNKELHYLAGKQITAYLSDYLHNKTGIEKVTFDEAQSKLRQVRFLAEQKEFRKLNKTPFAFTYQVEEKTKYIAPNVPAYRYSDHRTPYGTIYEQFNNSNKILSVAQQNGFRIVSNGVNKIRVKHPNTTSATSGEIDKNLNLYFNYSESVSSKKSFTPSEMVCYFGFSGNWSDFRKYLIEQGYKEKKKPQDEINAISEELKKQLIPITDEKEAGKVIFSYCYDLQTLEPEEKKAFIKQTCTRTEFENLFKAYLNLPDYRIQFDKNFTIQNYVSEALPAILDYTDVHKKVILRAETGKGKTTAFIRDFHKHRPNARLLVLVPLTVILRQNRKEYGDKGVFVDGSNVSYDMEKTYYENLVFATYEQGAKILHYSSFDYVVIDEAHQLLTANSFKRSVIAELTPHLEQNKVIGLTGTPTAIFKNIGYKIIDVDVKQPQKTAIEVRYLNKKPFNIALSHLSKVSGKTLMRLNDIKGIEILKKQLVSTKIFKESEILVLYSQEQIKSSQDYKQLAHERRFNDKIRLVLTTSLIDEGLSINQSGFTDVVFIETDYNPRPEPIKQFFARFRNEDKDRKNYLYLRTKKDQTAGRFVPEWSYKETLRALQNELNETNEDDVLSTYNSLFGNDPFFYEDKTVNKYYLGYSVTDILFKSLNVLQFRQFLEDNYNLQLSENKTFEFENPSISLEAHTRKEIKKAIAGFWLSKKTEVLQILALHSLDTSIRKKLSIKQIGVSPEAKQFVLKQIKEFEKLYKSSEIIKGLGWNNTNGILLKYSINEFGNSEVTLNSDKVIKEEIMLLKLKNVIENPQNPNDKKEAARFIKFSIWCEDKKEFTNPQMFRELKKLGVRKNAAYNENRIFTILQWFDLVAKRNKKTNLITVKNKVV